MKNKIINEIMPVSYNGKYENEFSYVLGVKYGDEGILATSPNEMEWNVLRRGDLYGAD